MQLNTEELLTPMDAFMRTLYILRAPLGLTPTKDHVATCINYADLQAMREAFVSELVATMVPFVYSEEKRQALVKQFSDGRSEAGAGERVRQLCLQKFRQSSSQAQFAELLLCNFLQYFFRAAPLVRKMPITTNPRLERQGADAIHIACSDEKVRFYLGEAKTYAATQDTLKAAFRDAISDLVFTHYANLHNELNLYVYDSFVPPALEDIARGFLAGEHTNVEVHLVAIIAYDYRVPINGNRQQRLSSIMDSIKADLMQVCTSPTFRRIEPDVIPRMNYIFFPVPALHDLLARFRQGLGLF